MSSAWKLVRLREDHPVDAFSCGTRPGSIEINQYLTESALSEQAARLAAVWIVEDAAATSRAECIVGYFTLSPVSVRLSHDILQAMSITAPYQMIGGWLLGRMGLAERHQGHDHGRRLVASAIRIARTLRDATAGTLLAIDPANAELMQWYLQLDFGFRRLAPNDAKMRRLVVKL